MKLCLSAIPLSLLSIVPALAGTTPPAKAAITEKVVEYREGDTVLEGFLAEPKTVTKNTPAIVVVHEWMGLGDYAKMRARMLAELGYVAFAADIYGKGVRAKDMDEAGKLATRYKSDRPLMRKRILAAIETASKLPNVDSKRIAVMGYCFGGTVALEAARAHAPVIAAISFHGGLSSPTAKDTKDLGAKIIVVHRRLGARAQLLQRGAHIGEAVVGGGG